MNQPLKKYVRALAFSFTTLALVVFFQNFTVHNSNVVGGYTYISKQLSPGGGGRMPGIFPSQTNPDLLFVATDMGTLFKTVNATATSGNPAFEQVNLQDLNIQNSLEFHYSRPWIYGLDSQNPFALAGTKTGIYKTTNWNTWAPVNSTFLASYISTSENCNNLVVAANNSSIIYSKDSGDTWLPLNAPNLPQGDQLQEVFFRELSVSNNFMKCGVSPVDTRFTLVLGYRTGGMYTVLYDSTNNSYTVTAILPPLPTEGGQYLRDIKGVKNGTGMSIYAIFDYNASTSSPTTANNLHKFSFTTNSWTKYPIKRNSGDQNQRPFAYLDTIALDRNNPDHVSLIYAGLDSNYNPNTQPPNMGQDHGGVYESFNASSPLTVTFQDIFFSRKDQGEGGVNIFNSQENWLSTSDWQWHQKPDYISLSSAAPGSHCIYTSQGGVYQKCTTTGVTWRALSMGPLTNNLSDSTGIAVMAIWDYTIAKSKDNQFQHFMANSDFAFFQSPAYGNQWKRRDYPGLNNVYQFLIEDPASYNAAETHAFAVGGGRHGIPNWGEIDDIDLAIDKGKIAYTTNNFDGIISKSVSGTVTGLLKYGNTNPPDAQTELYFTALKYGVFKFNYLDFINGTAGAPTPELVNPSNGNNNFVKIDRNGPEIWATAAARPSGVGVSLQEGNIFVKLTPTGSWFQLLSRTTSPTLYIKDIHPDDQVAPYPVAISFNADASSVARDVFYVASRTLANTFAVGGLWKINLNHNDHSLPLHASSAQRITYGAVNSVTVDTNSNSKVYFSVFETQPFKSDINFGFPASPSLANGLYEYNPTTNLICRIKNFIGRRPLAIKIYGSTLYLTSTGNGVIQIPMAGLDRGDCCTPSEDGKTCTP